MKKFDLTLNESGVSGSLSDRENDTDSEDWWNAKTGDRNAALRLVKKIWKKERSDELARRFCEPAIRAFVSVPSTTGENMLADTLARFLAEKFKGVFVSGKDIYRVGTEIQMKHVGRKEKLFSKRNYEKIEGIDIDILAARRIVVVDDLIVSGASIYEFIRELRRDGIETEAVACLFGDPLVAPSDSDIQKFSDAARKIGVDVHQDMISRLFAHGELVNLVEAIDELDSKEEKDAFAFKLQGLFDDRLAESMGQGAKRSCRRIGKFHGRNHERIHHEIQALPDIMVGDVMGRRQGGGRRDDDGAEEPGGCRLDDLDEDQQAISPSP